MSVTEKIIKTIIALAVMAAIVLWVHWEKHRD